MREIKFRAWDDFDKRMGLVTDICFENDVCVNFSPDVEYEKFEWQDIVLMQYTGLKDKNGKEIYEEDILLMPFKKQLVRSSKPGKKNFNVAIEFFPENGWLFQWPKNMGEYQYACGYKNSEVIGNIYENPEILK